MSAQNPSLGNADGSEAFMGGYVGSGFNDSTPPVHGGAPSSSPYLFGAGVPTAPAPFAPAPQPPSSPAAVPSSPIRYAPTQSHTMGSITQYAAPQVASSQQTMPSAGMQNLGSPPQPAFQPGHQPYQYQGVQQSGMYQGGMQQSGIYQGGVQQSGMQGTIQYNGMQPGSIQQGAMNASAAQVGNHNGMHQSTGVPQGMGNVSYHQSTSGSIAQSPGPQYRPHSTAMPSTPQAISYAARSAHAYASSGASANTVAAPQGGVYNQMQQPHQMQHPHQVPQANQPHQVEPQLQQPANAPTAATAPKKLGESPAEIAQQNRLLTDATRQVQEHAYYMRQAMEKNDLPVVLERAALMVGQLGENTAAAAAAATSPMPPGHMTPSGSEATQLNPKNYYELHMRALEDMPNLEEYLLSISKGTSVQTVPGTITITLNPESSPVKYTMQELYDCVQYCPHVLSRLYLQICAGSALIRSGEATARWVMDELIQAVKCVQNPLRGLFLRHFLLQVLRDKLPDVADADSSADEELQNNKDGGTVMDSCQFILANFIEMNKLWVRIQHLPGEGKSKEQRRRRERERNELRILVGTNLVRLSQLEEVTSQMYGEIILPTILDHIVACGDPLAQAYLIDCITQVFPDEYHIETLPILLGVCPKLRDKVNIRTILQSLMDRLANYLADEELLDETDTNQVKKSLARDSFPMFEQCVQNVYNARGPKLLSKEVIRLQTALLSYSLRCYEGDMEQVNRCLQVCVSALRQANMSYEVGEGGEEPPPLKPLDEVSKQELEKLLSIPLESLALRVLQLDHFASLLAFLPWNGRREVALKLLRAVESAGSPPSSVQEIEELFRMAEPVIRDEKQDVIHPHESTVSSSLMAGLGASDAVQISAVLPEQSDEKIMESSIISKLVHLLDNDDTDVVYEMLDVARKHICSANSQRNGQVMVALIFSALRLARRVYVLEHQQKNDVLESVVTEGISESKVDDAEVEVEESVAKEEEEEEEVAESTVENAEEEVDQEPDSNEEQNTEVNNDKEDQLTQPVFSKSVSCRKIFVFLQQAIAALAKIESHMSISLYLEVALAADHFAGPRTSADFLEEYSQISYEMISQAYILYEQAITDAKLQHGSIVRMMGTLMECRSLSKEDYESLVTKAAQYSAKLFKKSDQCLLVASCAHLFYPADGKETAKFRNPQRALECLQRGLKLADVCTSTNPAHIRLFIDLFEHYVFFFEKKNPLITAAYVNGLAALIKEHLRNVSGYGGPEVTLISDARAQFLEIETYIKKKKNEPDSAEQFEPIAVD